MQHGFTPASEQERRVWPSARRWFARCTVRAAALRRDLRSRRAGCGDQRPAAPDITTPRPPDGTHPDGVSGRGGDACRCRTRGGAEQGTSPLVASIASGTARWRSGATRGPSRRPRSPTRCARPRTRSWAPRTSAIATLRISRAAVVRFHGRPALRLSGPRRWGQPRTVRSTHIFTRPREVVVDALAPPGVRGVAAQRVRAAPALAEDARAAIAPAGLRCPSCPRSRPSAASSRRGRGAALERLRSTTRAGASRSPRRGRRDALEGRPSSGSARRGKYLIARARRRAPPALAPAHDRDAAARPGAGPPVRARVRLALRRRARRWPSATRAASAPASWRSATRRSTRSRRAARAGAARRRLHRRSTCARWRATAARRSRPCCSTSGASRASGTSTPTRRCSAPRIHPLRAAGR